MLVCRNDHTLAKARRLRWTQLESHALIVPGSGSSNRPLLDGALGPAAAALRPLYEVQRSSTAVGMVAAGVAVAVVPRLALQAGSYPQLRVIPLVEPVISRAFELLTRRTAVLSPAAEALYELIQQRARAARASRGIPQIGA